jgi:hypothetical protein
MVKTLTEKDCPKNALVFMYESFVRDTDDDVIINHIKTYISHLQTLTDVNQQNIYIEYLILVMFSIRNCRGGKGHRNIFIQMWNTIYQYYPEQLDSFIPFIPHYGSWRDIVLLIINGTEQSRCRLYEFIIEGLRKDIDLLDKEKTNELSFVAKWCPKEGSASDKKCSAARECAKRLYPELYAENFTMALRKYRQDVSRLNKALHTTEVIMCNKQFSKINFNDVPKKALIKYNRAFLNVSVMDENETRHPDDDDRRECRIHYEQYLCNKNTKSTKNKTEFDTLLLNEIIDKIQKTSNHAEITELESTWNSHMLSHNYALANGILFTTMNDTYNISTTLALAISSQQMIPAYNHRFITCSNEPVLVEIPMNCSLLEQIKHMNENIKSGYGSIDFEKTMQLILTQARIYRLSPEQLPKWCLIVGVICNESFHISSIHREKIIAEFAKVGIEICGKPYTIPEIIVWNVYNNTEQYPIVLNEPNYKLINGFSQALLNEIAYNNILKIKSITPWKNLKYILNGYEYEQLRTSIREQFKPIESTMDDTEVISPKTCSSPPPVKDTNGIINYLRSFF